MAASPCVLPLRNATPSLDQVFSLASPTSQNVMNNSNNNNSSSSDNGSSPCVRSPTKVNHSVHFPEHLEVAKKATQLCDDVVTAAAAAVASSHDELKTLPVDCGCSCAHGLEHDDDCGCCRHDDEHAGDGNGAASTASSTASVHKRRHCRHLNNSNSSSSSSIASEESAYLDLLETSSTNSALSNGYDSVDSDSSLGLRAYSAFPAPLHRRSKLEELADLVRFSKCLTIDRGDSVQVGDYEVTELIGRGGYAEVKLATHLHSGQQFAAKVIKRTALADASGDEKAFELVVSEEVRIMCLLGQNPFSPTLYEVVETEDAAYLFMEYIRDANNLYTHLCEHWMRLPRLSEDEGRRIFKQIVDAVEYCHSRGVAHRDLKVENIMIDRERGTIRLIDFGTSATFAPGTAVPHICGTPEYAAPETHLAQPCDAAAVDVWSLGVLFFFMLQKAYPFQSKQQLLSGTYCVRHNCSSDAKHLLRSMLTADPSQRATISDIKKHKWLNPSN